jgi:transposase
VKKSIRIVAGLDVGSEWCHLFVEDFEEGVVLWDGRVPTEAAALRSVLRRWKRIRIALEVGTQSPWLQELLEGLGHEVYVANARKLRCIWASTNKQDRLDARVLARVAHMDPSLLHPIRHRRRETQEDLAVLRARNQLVQLRSGLVGMVRGMVRSHGGRVPPCETEDFARRARGHLPKGLVPAVTPLLGTIEELSRRIEAYDGAVETMAREKYPEVEALTRVPGVGTLTALCFVLTLEDPSRFRKSRDVGPALGLVPRRDQSGKTDKHLSITRTGDDYLRSLLVESAHCVLRKATRPSALKDWGRKLASRGGKAGKRRAVVAVARKLAVLLHRLWVTQAVYERYRDAKKALKAA